MRLVGSRGQVPRARTAAVEPARLADFQEAARVLPASLFLCDAEREMTVAHRRC